MSFSWDKASRDCLATNGVPRFIQRYPISKSGVTSEVAYRHDQQCRVRDSPTASARHASSVFRSSVLIAPMFASVNCGLTRFD